MPTKVNNDWLVSDLSEAQRGHLAWRLDRKTYYGLIGECTIALLDAPQKDMSIYKLFIEFGMNEEAAKINAYKVINFKPMFCKHVWKLCIFQALNGLIGESDYECTKCGKIEQRKRT